MKSCGIVVRENYIMVSAQAPSVEANNINWANVSDEFKTHFMASWEEAYKGAKESDDNQYMNVLCVLDRLGYMINEGQIPKDMSFDDGYDKALSEIFDELHNQ